MMQKYCKTMGLVCVLSAMACFSMVGKISNAKWKTLVEKVTKQKKRLTKWEWVDLTSFITDETLRPLKEAELIKIMEKARKLKAAGIVGYVRLAEEVDRRNQKIKDKKTVKPKASKRRISGPGWERYFERIAQKKKELTDKQWFRFIAFVTEDEWRPLEKEEIFKIMERAEDEEASGIDGYLQLAKERTRQNRIVASDDEKWAKVVSVVTKEGHKLDKDEWLQVKSFITRGKDRKLTKEEFKKILKRTERLDVEEDMFFTGRLKAEWRRHDEVPKKEKEEE